MCEEFVNFSLSVSVIDVLKNLQFNNSRNGCLSRKPFKLRVIIDIVFVHLCHSICEKFATPVHLHGSILIEQQGKSVKV